MTIRVHMKRKVSKDHEQALKQRIDRLRSVATGQPGYISGETLKRVDAPGESLVVSKWKSHQAWEAWFNSPEREALQGEIEALLGTATEYEIYEYE